jgi:hypothetical protein
LLRTNTPAKKERHEGAADQYESENVHRQTPFEDCNDVSELDVTTAKKSGESL